MCDYLQMLGTYEQRKVDCFDGVDKDGNNYTIDTCMITDDELYPYETAVAHNLFKIGLWIIVEKYKTKEAAIIGHNKWVDMLNKEIPNRLYDCRDESYYQARSE